MASIIPFPHNPNHERAQRLSPEQYDSVSLRWPVRHKAEALGAIAYQRAFAPPIQNTLGSNVVDLATRQNNYRSETPAAPQSDLDIDAIRRQVDIEAA